MAATAIRGRFGLAASLLMVLLVVSLTSARTLRQPNRGPFDPTWARIQDRGYLIVGIDPSIPPFGEFGEGDPVGLDPAIAKEIGARLGLDVRFLLLSFDGLYDSLLLANSDLVIAALRPDPMRTDRIRYTQPYFDAGHVLVTADGMFVPSLDYMEGGTLAVEFASEGDIAARQVKDLTILRYFTAAEAIDAVLNYTAQAALVDRVSVLTYAQTYFAPDPWHTLSISSQTIIPDPYAIAIHRQDWRLYEAVKNALAEMQADGTLARLTKEWVESPESAPHN